LTTKISSCSSIRSMPCTIFRRRMTRQTRTDSCARRRWPRQRIIQATGGSVVTPQAMTSMENGRECGITQRSYLESPAQIISSVRLHCEGLRLAINQSLLRADTCPCKFETEGRTAPIAHLSFPHNQSTRTYRRYRGNSLMLSGP
jgi:hypothetical protein